VNSTSLTAGIADALQTRNASQHIGQNSRWAGSLKAKRMAPVWTLVCGLALYLASPISEASDTAANTEESEAFYSHLTERMCSEPMLACTGISKATCQESIVQIKAECPSPLPTRPEAQQAESQSTATWTAFMSCYRAKIVSRWPISIEKFRACRGKVNGHAT
jgi:hypothetical protein